MFIKHRITKLDKDIKKKTGVVSLMGAITSIGFDLLAFFMQLGKNEILKGNIVLGLTFITIYYIRNVLHDFISVWQNEIVANYKENYHNTINSKVIEILLKVRGKVWRTNEKTNAREVMSTNVLLSSSKYYISMVWDFKTNMPMNIFQITSAILMFVGFIMVTTIEIEHILLFVSIIVIVSIASVIFSIKRNSLNKRFMKDKKNLEEELDIAMNDCLNIEPINEKHAKYMTGKYISLLKEKFAFSKKDRKSINLVNLCQSLLNSIATIVIISMKVFETGIGNINLEVVLSIVALMTIYSQIMNRVNSIVHMFEDMKNSLESIKNYQSDFLAIIEVLDDAEKESNCGEKGLIEQITVPTFCVQYEVKGDETPFMLKNKEPMEFKPGDIVLFTGATGSGKSTLMKMLTRQIKFYSFELFYKRKKNGYINCIMHQTDGRLGSGSVLSELTFGQELDKEKLLHILKGVHLYEEISEKNVDVIDYLKTSKVYDYSSGQKQRLAIARLLYNLDEDIQIIGFDEPTNALSDEVTLQTLEFIKNYCPEKILFVATHQIEIGKTIATKRLKFQPNGDHYEVSEV